MRSKWSMLPEELRLQVLETLAHSSFEKHGLTNYALVCKSWKSIFEKANFRSLTIDQEDFEHLAKIPKRCWPYVKHVWLRIELEKYYPMLRTGSVPTLSNTVDEKHARKPNPYIGMALANKSLGFDNLAATFLVEASDFFQAYKPEWIWRDLRSLTLTSYLLDPKRKVDEINGMLQAAGVAALAMPMLQTLEIWNGGVGHAAVFAYHAERGEAAISWTSTWDLVFNPYIVDVWRKVGYKNHRCEKLGIEQRLIEDTDAIRRYVDVIELLRTKKHVISRQSLDELRLSIESLMFLDRASMYLLCDNTCLAQAIMAAQSNLRRTAAEDALAEFLEKWTGILGKRLRSTSRTTRTLATLSLALSIILGAEGSRRWWKKRRHENEQGRKLVRTNSWLHNKDGSRTIYVPYKDGTSKVVINTTKPLTFEAHRRLFLNPPRVSGLGDGTVPSAQTKPGLNLAFLHQFLSLMSIMIPRWSSKEAGLLLSHGVFLMLRTYLSLVVARLDGELVRDLVAGQGKAFLWGIVKWCGLGTFASYTNAMIKFLESKVSIAFRTRLTRYIHDIYLNENLNYYKLSNLDGGVGQGADQFITQDLTLFCASAANLYSSLGKPFVDICVFSFQLYRSLGPLAWIGLMSNYFLTASILRKLSPPFGKLKAVEGRKEGDFRSLHARLIANAEEVAFYGGAEMEKTFLNKEYKSLKSWMEGIYMLKIRYNILEDFILKYSWSAYGYLLASLPVFLPAWGGVGGAAEMAEGGEKGGRERNRMKSFITNKRLMLSLADAGGRMMYSIKDLAELAGYTSRVYTLISTLHRVHANAYYLRSGQSELYSLSDVQGTIQKGFDGVRFEQVPVVAPGLWPQGGEELVESLSMIVRRGEHLLISGPNGVGKSAISRILAGLWPVYRGLVSRPKSIGEDGIMFLPQRPYLSPGTLRDQVIYPDGHVDMREKRKSENDLQKILEAARLGYLPDREGGWDTRKEWKDVLSGGEKQRMQFARLLYHEPQYAIIDEGTSAVSSDVEGLLYETCKERGITLITISTRASLKKYHTYNLQLGVGDDADSWEFERIGTEREKMQVEKEVQDLRERLAQVDELKKRREEIEKELNAVWTEKGDLLDAPSYIGIDEAPVSSEESIEA
ncbi:peroxisomal long-chain fatty acid import protein 2 [Trichoderma asperellum]|uniref:Peroxisomal long-chain fatty acid import protein 2 n=1 Tax=Trichoderma asperellum TaxID=101201 RepID=A0A6V8RBJ9_TRIAP|nr:peroxisomal long-chain fatty acid import protein 2 [Trichoderma asperellum]